MMSLTISSLCIPRVRVLVKTPNRLGTYYWKIRMFDDIIGPYYLQSTLAALEDPEVGQVCCQEYKGKMDNRNPNTIVKVRIPTDFSLMY
jgi:hypothetical protein